MVEDALKRWKEVSEDSYKIGSIAHVNEDEGDGLGSVVILVAFGVQRTMLLSREASQGAVMQRSLLMAERLGGITSLAHGVRHPNGILCR